MCSSRRRYAVDVRVVVVIVRSLRRNGGGCILAGLQSAGRDQLERNGRCAVLKYVELRSTEPSIISHRRYRDDKERLSVQCECIFHFSRKQALYICVSIAQIDAYVRYSAKIDGMFIPTAARIPRNKTAIILTNYYRDLLEDDLAKTSDLPPLSSLPEADGDIDAFCALFENVIVHLQLLYYSLTNVMMVSIERVHINQLRV